MGHLNLEYQLILIVLYLITQLIEQHIRKVHNTKYYDREEIAKSN